MQSEKIDTFALANILYAIATGKKPWDDQGHEEHKRLVIAGKPPPLDQAFIDSDHPADKALVEAMNMCFIYDWRKRPSSAEVRDLLREELKNGKHLRQESHASTR